MMWWEGKTTRIVCILYIHLDFEYHIMGWLATYYIFEAAYLSCILEESIEVHLCEIMKWPSQFKFRCLPGRQRQRWWGWHTSKFSLKIDIGVCKTSHNYCTYFIVYVWIFLGGFDLKTRGTINYNPFQILYVRQGAKWKSTHHSK